MSAESVALRKAAAYVREHGFSPSLREPNGCGCFLNAIAVVGGMSTYDAGNDFWPLLSPVVGCAFTRDELIKHGWTSDATDDAVAALEIAACLAE